MKRWRRDIRRIKGKMKCLKEEQLSKKEEVEDL